MPASETQLSVSVLGHDIEQIYFDGEEWRIVCACTWETWGWPDGEGAREAFNDHVFDDVNTRLRKLHDAREAERGD